MIVDLIAEMEEALKVARPDLFQDLIRNGLFSTDILFYREVFLYFDKEKKIGNNVVQAVRNTSEKFDIGERNVYIIIKKMK